MIGYQNEGAIVHNALSNTYQTLTLITKLVNPGET